MYAPELPGAHPPAAEPVSFNALAAAAAPCCAQYGAEVALGERFKGKVIVLVNVASA